VRIVKRAAGGREVTLKTLSAGEAFGEAALAAAGRRSATARAKSDVSVLSISADELEAALGGAPAAAARLRRVMTSRGLRDILRAWTGVGGVEQGRVVERGDHRSLMEAGGLYYQLCSQQLAG